MNLRIKSGLEFRRLGDEGILMDTETCKFYRLSPQATDVWETLLLSNATKVNDGIMSQFRQIGLLEFDGDTFLPSASETHIVEHHAFTVHASHILLRWNQTQCANKGGVWKAYNGECRGH